MLRSYDQGEGEFVGEDESAFDFADANEEPPTEIEGVMTFD